MYFHLVYYVQLTRIFQRRVASGRKSTRKLFRQVTELMVTEDHEFVGNSTSPPFAFLSNPFHMGLSLPLGKRLTRFFGAFKGVEKPKILSCANANFVDL